MQKSYRQRRKILEQTIKQSNILRLVKQEYTKDPKTINLLNQQEKKEGLEGIMIKKADSTYVPGRTGWRWVKMKESEKDYAKLADTVDAIIMGYSAGKGKRAQFGLGQFLVGVRKGETIVTITKVGTGITDEQFVNLEARLKKLVVNIKPKVYKVDKNLKPDYWAEPKLVVEVAADGITKSPTHSAGLALRFPKLIRLRSDKSLDQATSFSEIKKLYKLQQKGFKVVVA